MEVIETKKDEYEWIDPGRCVEINVTRVLSAIAQFARVGRVENECLDSSGTYIDFAPAEADAREIIEQLHRKNSIHESHMSYSFNRLYFALKALCAKLVRGGASRERALEIIGMLGVERKLLRQIFGCGKTKVRM